MQTLKSLKSFGSFGSSVTLIPHPHPEGARQISSKFKFGNDLPTQNQSSPIELLNLIESSNCVSLAP